MQHGRGSNVRPTGVLPAGDGDSAGHAVCRCVPPSCAGSKWQWGRIVLHLRRPSPAMPDLVLRLVALVQVCRGCSARCWASVCSRSGPGYMRRSVRARARARVCWPDVLPPRLPLPSPATSLRLPARCIAAPMLTTAGEDPYVGAVFANAYIRGSLDASAAAGVNYTAIAACGEQIHTNPARRWANNTPPLSLVCGVTTACRACRVPVDLQPNTTLGTQTRVAARTAPMRGTLTPTSSSMRSPRSPALSEQVGDASRRHCLHERALSARQDVHAVPATEPACCACYRTA